MALTKAEKEKLEHLENELAGSNKFIGEQIEQINSLEAELQAAKDALQNIVISDQFGNVFEYDIVDGCIEIQVTESEHELSDLPTRKELRLALSHSIDINHGDNAAMRIDKAIDDMLRRWSS